MIPRDFHFEMGAFAYLFFLIPFLLLLFQSARTRRKLALQKLHLLDAMVVERSAVKSLIQEALFILSFVFLVFALMKPVGFGSYPQGMKVEEKEFRSLKPVYFVLDTSLSMLVKDGAADKSRFVSAKEIIDTTIEELRGVPVGYKTFTSHLKNVSPITYDSFYLRLLVRDTPIIGSNNFGTNFLSLFTELDESLGSPAEIVLLSDGEDTSTYHAKQARQEQRRTKIVDEVLKLRERGIVVTTVGVGTEEGGDVPGIHYEDKKVVSKADFALLEEIALSAGSKFYDAKRWPVRELALHLATRLETPTMSGEEIKGPSVEVVYRPLFYYPLVLGLLCFFGAAIMSCPKRRVSR